MSTPLLTIGGAPVPWSDLHVWGQISALLRMMKYVQADRLSPSLRL